MVDRSGQQFGDYRFLRHLGSGTFGDVYLGEQIYLKTYAAIKVLHAQLDQTEFERFLEEARTIAALEHPHIVRVLSFSIQHQIPYLVMQLAQSSLKDRFAPGHPQPIEAILPYVRQAAKGLQYAHNQRVMHLDIKPANLLLNTQNQVLLADFGLATTLQTQRTHQTVHGFAGTAAYAAPEQFQNRPGLASDQYALGVIVYQWLVGRLPFEGDWLAIGHQKVNEDPPSLYTKVPGISSAVEDVVLRALAKNSSQRFASVQDFATALEQAVQGKFSASKQETSSSAHQGAAPQQPLKLRPTEYDAIRQTLTLSPEEASRGTTRTLTLPSGELLPITISPGVSQGQSIAISRSSAPAIIITIQISNVSSPHSPYIDALSIRDRAGSWGCFSVAFVILGFAAGLYLLGAFFLGLFLPLNTDAPVFGGRFDSYGQKVGILIFAALCSALCFGIALSIILWKRAGKRRRSQYKQ